jgi:hypothetical protein
MPLFDLNSPTELLFQWGWLLLTRANGIVYLLVVAVLILGMTVRLPRAKRDIAAVEAHDASPNRPADEASS